MKQVYNTNNLITILFFLLVMGFLSGIAIADCNGPCPFSPVINNSTCGSCGCTDDLYLCSAAGSCAFNTLPVYMGAMTPGIAASTLSGPAPLSVQFRDTAAESEGTTTWTWDFGDGSTGTGESPVHVYLVPGTYNVTLSTSHGEKNTNLEWGLSASVQRTAVITVTPGANVQTQAYIPATAQAAASVQGNALTTVYTPPAGFTVPDIYRYREGYTKPTVSAVAAVRPSSGAGIYGY
ncbi:MAG TPA: PKD domain-containing protein [Methanoregulaceae archaeon]|nr:PKD domain-containing protein [Methanoregulaceae archaeon]